MYDLVIKNGHVIDPANQISARLDLGISNGRVAAVSAQPLSGLSVIDAEGLIVSPGFIDAHMHEDPYDSNTDSFDFCIAHTMLRMGVTTAIGGNCGIIESCDSPATYLDAVERKGYPINQAMLAPQEALRKALKISDIYQGVTDEEADRMLPLLDDLLKKGCLGISFGLEYFPGTSTHEINSYMKVAAKYGRPTAVHIRTDGDLAVSSVQEMIDAAKLQQTPLQISHLGSMCCGHMEECISTIDEAKASGCDVCFDCYPYAAYSTAIGSACFDDGFLQNLGYADEGYCQLEISSGSHKGERCTKESFFTIRKEEPDALVVAHLLRQDEVDRAICHPDCILASDGLLHGGQGHPRGSGSFPKYLHDYVTDKKLLSLEQALYKITAHPASRFGLNSGDLRKGSLSIGSDADIAIFDLPSVKDGATFDSPIAPPSGIRYVLIGGQVALKDGEILKNNCGTAIRKR